MKTKVLTDDTPMPFGVKHRGTKMANVPASYLMWIYESVERDYYSQPVINYIKENMDAIKLELNKSKS